MIRLIAEVAACTLLGGALAFVAVMSATVAYATPWPEMVRASCAVLVCCAFLMPFVPAINRL